MLAWATEFEQNSHPKRPALLELTRDGDGRERSIRGQQFLDPNQLRSSSPRLARRSSEMEILYSRDGALWS